MVRKVYPAEEINAGSDSCDEKLVGVEFQAQASTQECRNCRNEFLKPCAVVRENHKIVGVPDIVLHLEVVLHELIKFIHVDIDEKLRGEVAER